MAGLVALFFEIIKAARLGPGTIVDDMLSTATFIVAGVPARAILGPSDFLSRDHVTH